MLESDSVRLVPHAGQGIRKQRPRIEGGCNDGKQGFHCDFLAGDFGKRRWKTLRAPLRCAARTITFPASEHASFWP